MISYSSTNSKINSWINKINSLTCMQAPSGYVFNKDYYWVYSSASLAISEKFKLIDLLYGPQRTYYNVQQWKNIYKNLLEFEAYATPIIKEYKIKRRQEDLELDFI